MEIECFIKYKKDVFQPFPPPPNFSVLSMFPLQITTPPNLGISSGLPTHMQLETREYSENSCRIKLFDPILDIMHIFIELEGFLIQ